MGVPDLIVSKSVGRMCNIILTGFPGVGKTTLIKKVVHYLQTKNIDVTGFYTEEIRNDSTSRIGFDIITLEGKRGILARTKDHTNEQTKHHVGQYLVFPNQLETIVLPLFQDPSQVIVIDEIGKMELFSKKFKAEVEHLFRSHNKLIIATIPVNKGHSTKIIEDIRANPENVIITVDQSNRNTLYDEIIHRIHIE